MKTIIYIFRKDFRLIDNPALFAATKDGNVIPLFVLDENEEIGGASEWWLHQSIKKMTQKLEAMGSYLVLRKGSWVDEILRVINDYEVHAVYWNEGYDPYSRANDKKLTIALKQMGVDAKKFIGNVLVHPKEIKTQNHTPYKVYSAFKKKFYEQYMTNPFPEVKELTSPAIGPNSIHEIDLDSTKTWHAKLEQYWKVGERHAQTLLDEFIANKIDRYSVGRDFPFDMNVSRLSPYLSSGQISSRYIYSYIKNNFHDPDRNVEGFLQEIIWREFSQYIVFHYPRIIKEPLNEKFNYFSWDSNEESFTRWKKGQTGYPLVDAGMRELWETGYMHNRVRMITASFLTKHLLIPWQTGADWFMDTLLDSDIASNSFNWQWVAGSGTDAQPYFRIFNPIMQGKKFDANAEYIRKWVPELKNVPTKNIHFPADAPEETLKKVGFRLGVDYPYPIVDHKSAREAALERYAKIK